MAVSQFTVISVQLALTVAAFAVALLRPSRVRGRFYWAVYALIVLYVVAYWRTGEANLKFLYDVSIVPLFILIGSSLDRFPLRAVLIVVGIVTIVVGIELLWPEIYTRYINPLGYYIDTRDWVRGQFENQIIDDPGLYVGSQRPGGLTFLNFLSEYRLGSIFMEPLSLGYFAVIVSMIVNYFYADGRLAKYALLALCLLLAALADTRISVFCIIVITVMWPIARRVPPQLAFLPPFVALVGFIIVAATSGGAFGPAELAGRLSITVDALQNANVGDILFGGLDTNRSGDSAILAIVGNAGLLAVPLLLALYSGLLSARRPENALHWSAFLYVLVASLFGGALFSIKTAPLLGMLIGYASSHPAGRGAGET